MRRALRGPALVELLADGHVRSMPGAVDAFEGYWPGALQNEPSDRQGLLLYAQKVAPLHYGSPAGPIIGRLHPGAFVGVRPHDSGSFLVAVPRYSHNDRPLLAYVEPDALGPEPSEEQAPKLEGERLRDHWLWLTLSNGPRVRLLCGGFSAREAAGATSVTQYHEGVELTGIVDGIGLSRYPPGQHTCVRRLVRRKDGRLFLSTGKDPLDWLELDVIPGGFARVGLPEPDPVARLITERGSVYWVVQTRDGMRCEEWRFAGSLAKRRDGMRVFDGTLKRQRDPRAAEYSIGYWMSASRVGNLLLKGPHFRDDGYRCAEGVGLIDQVGEVLYIDEASFLMPSPSAGSPYEPVAYDAKDVERWYLTRSACESARRVADEQAADRGDEPVGVHRHCYPELMD
ncbi:MAG: hypothetical protein JW940_33145 [Polyangiaceae bacterium]|nr:hypothetical protein [Polyangiaceae bacterium]